MQFDRTDRAEEPAPPPVVRATGTRACGRFELFSRHTARATGHPTTFFLAVLVIAAWAITGPIFGFSDTWQLVINTGTTIVTFLMVFLIQASQNRDAAAVQLKLDELIRAIRGASNSLIDLEELDEKQLEKLRADYQRLADEERRRGRREAHPPVASDPRESGNGQGRT